MGTRSEAPPPLVPAYHDGDDRPRRPEPHTPVLLTAVAIDELLVAAHDRLGIGDAIHNLERVAGLVAQGELRRYLATLEGYPG
jgi:hypothetical protein